MPPAHRRTQRGRAVGAGVPRGYMRAHIGGEVGTTTGSTGPPGGSIGQLVAALHWSPRVDPWRTRGCKVRLWLLSLRYSSEPRAPRVPRAGFS